MTSTILMNQRKFVRIRTDVTRLAVENFTAFKQLDIQLSPGINVFIGANGTGKTHLLKLIYSCLAFHEEDELARKLLGVFMPYGSRLNRMVHRRQGGVTAKVSLFRGRDGLRFSFNSRSEKNLIDLTGLQR